MIRIATSMALVAIAIPLAAAVAQTLSPILVFEGNTTIREKNGATQPIHVSVQSWGIAGQNGATHEIPLRGFYVAHLIGGNISTTIDGQTTKRVAENYWTVKAGATMQIKVQSEFAVLETIIASKE